MPDNSTIKSWLSEYKALPESQVSTFSQQLIKNDKPLIALCDLFETASLTTKNEFIPSVCHQLFEFLRHDDDNLFKFVLSLLPSMLDHYLSAIAHGKKGNSLEVEFTVLSMYHISTGKIKHTNIRIPSIARSSIYHDPVGLLPLPQISELRNINSGVIRVGHQPKVESITAHNRMPIVTHLMTVYNSFIGLIPTVALDAVCRATSSLCREGFEHMNFGGFGLLTSDPHLASEPAQPSKPRLSARIDLSPELLTQLTAAVNFCLYNGNTELAIGALDDVRHRSAYDLLPEVTVMIQAISSQLESRAGGAPLTRLNVVTGGGVVTGDARGGAITLGTFRSKKMPDDIEIRRDELDAGAASTSNHNASAAEASGSEAVRRRTVKFGGLTIRIPQPAIRRKRRESIYGGPQPKVDAPASPKSPSRRHRSNIFRPKHRGGDHHSIEMTKLSEEGEVKEDGGDDENIVDTDNEESTLRGRFRVVSTGSNFSDD